MSALLRIFTVITMSTVTVQNISAQETCSVALENLKGTYTGDCKKGMADGEGKAKGRDSYEGHFKKGYPDGKGIYHYANGDYYDGEFKKGLPDGTGEFHYVSVGADDRVVTGKWENGVHKDYDKPYKIYSRTSGVTRVNVKEQLAGGINTIAVETKSLRQTPELSGSQNVRSASNGSPGAGYRDPGADINQAKYKIPIYEITNSTVISGNFVNIFKRNTDKVAVTEFQNVEFPFHAIIYIDTDQIIEFEIFKPGSWIIEATISKE